MPDQRPVKVAIIGGGCAAITAAYHLTSAEQAGRFEVTVYQQGFRLGGKGASGRGPFGRIEEHGLHVWMGFYENAFRTIRGAYEELDRDPSQHPIATWRDAFTPAPHIGLAHQANQEWMVWSTVFPPLPGLPGDPLSSGADNPFTAVGYLTRLSGVMGALLATAMGDPMQTERLYDPRVTHADLLTRASMLLTRVGGAVDTAAAVLKNQLETLAGLAHVYAPGVVAGMMVQLARAALALLERVRPNTADNPQRQQAGEVLEVTLAAMVGMVTSGALTDPRGLDMLDDLEFRDFLRQNGASEHAVCSTFMRGLYSLMFAYEGGDSSRPRQAAGQSVRGCLRMFFTYRGAFFWKMQAGMGDIIFAPLYEVLKRRGVRFEFFHRLENISLGRAVSDEGPGYVDALELSVQARVKDGEYNPLVDIRGVPSWPSLPDWAQLVDGESLAAKGVQFESHWEQQSVAKRTLHVGSDFDFVVLGVSVAALPFVASELLESDARWRAMTDNLATVATQALQVWTSVPMTELGWRRGPVTMTSFLDPFDTWADMTHLLPAEDWPEGSIGAVAYFCNVLDERDIQCCEPRDAGYQQRVQSVVQDHARSFVGHTLAELWPGLVQNGQSAWSMLTSWDGCQSPADALYHVGNVNPSDRYVQCMPGTMRYRISPLDRSYDNLAITGDWTSCGMSLGCVESAVMSGMLASHALSSLPPLEAIIGYDHP